MKAAPAVAVVAVRAPAVVVPVRAVAARPACCALVAVVAAAYLDSLAVVPALAVGVQGWPAFRPRASWAWFAFQICSVFRPAAPAAGKQG